MNEFQNLGDEIFKGINLPSGTGQSPLPPSSKGVVPIATNDEDVRNDPRHGTKLLKKRIQKDDGSWTITIDYKPETGGVFLDKGELKDLSEIKNIEAILRNVLSH